MYIRDRRLQTCDWLKDYGILFELFCIKVMLFDVNMLMFIQGPMEDHYLLVNGLPWQKIRKNK